MLFILLWFLYSLVYWKKRIVVYIKQTSTDWHSREYREYKSLKQTIRFNVHEWLNRAVSKACKSLLELNLHVFFFFLVISAPFLSSSSSLLCALFLFFFFLPAKLSFGSSVADSSVTFTVLPFFCWRASLRSRLFSFFLSTTPYPFWFPLESTVTSATGFLVSLVSAGVLAAYNVRIFKK